MKTPRILIVDDEEDIRSMYRTILSKKEKGPLVRNENNDIGFMKTGSLPDSDEVALFFGDEDPEIEVEDELKTGCYSLSEASQGEEAVKLIQEALQENNPFSLMFLDIQMPPGIDGVQTAKKIRRLDKDLQIVIMTSYSDYTFDDIVKTVESEDRLLFFKKPFKKDQILQLASTLTQRWQLDREK